MNAHIEERRLPGAATTLWNVIVAPAAAFDALAARPTWVLAFIVTAILWGVGQIAMYPATLHAFATWYPTALQQDPRAASMTAAQRDQALAFSLTFLRVGAFVSALSGLLAALATGLVLWIATLLSGTTPGFRRMFALAMNVAVLSFGIGQLANAAIVLARGPAAFTAPWQVPLALPSVAWLAPSAPPKVLGFLMGLNPFSLWSLALLGAGTARIARIRSSIAYAGATIVTLCSCAFDAIAVR